MSKEEGPFVVRFIGRPRKEIVLRDLSFAKWADPIPLAVEASTPPHVSHLSGKLSPGESFAVRLLSRPMTPKEARLSLEKLGLEVTLGPIKIRSGVRPPRRSGMGMDEWIASLVWRGPARILRKESGPAVLGPFLVCDLAKETTP